MSTRRDFLKQGGAVAGTLALGGALHTAGASAVPGVSSQAPAMDAVIRELLMESLNAAKSGGASYADARIGRYLQNFVVTREQQITNVVDTDSIGIGVRALVNGAWGFAASRDLRPPLRSGTSPGGARMRSIPGPSRSRKRPTCSCGPTPRG